MSLVARTQFLFVFGHISAHTHVSRSKKEEGDIFDSLSRSRSLCLSAYACVRPAKNDHSSRSVWDESLAAKVRRRGQLPRAVIIVIVDFAASSGEQWVWE